MTSKKFDEVLMITDVSGRPHPQWPDKVGFTYDSKRGNSNLHTFEAICRRLEIEGGVVYTHKLDPEGNYRLTNTVVYHPLTTAPIVQLDESSIIDVGVDIYA